MDFDLTDGHRALVAQVRSYARSHFDRASVERWRHDAGLPDEVVKDFVDLDFCGYGVVHRREHRYYDMLAQVLVLEELARVSGATLPFQNDMLQLRMLEGFASPEQTDPVRLAYQDTGRLTFAFAVSEPQGGSDAMRMRTTVATREGRLVLNGTKVFVNNGEYAPLLLVAAIDADAAPRGRHPALSMWLIPHDLPGVRVVPEAKIGQSILPFASIQFTEVELLESYRLTGEDLGWPQLFGFFEYGRTYVCATALGLAQAAMEDAVAWARERMAFGSPVADFQQVQEMLTDMEVRLANMRHLVYRAAWEFDAGRHDRLTVAMMKRYVPRTATEVASDAMQILGGRGYTPASRVAHVWQDCRGFQIAEGTDQIMVHIAAPLVMGRYAASEAARLQTRVC